MPVITFFPSPCPSRPICIPVAPNCCPHETDCHMICLSSSALSQLCVFLCAKSITKRSCTFSSFVGLLLYYLSSAVLGCPCRGEVEDFCWRFLNLFKATVFSAFTRRKSVHLQESNQDAVFELSTQSMESSVTKMRRRKLSLCWSAIAYTRHKFFRCSNLYTCLGDWAYIESSRTI